MKNNKDHSKNRKIAPEAFRDWFIGKLMGYYSKEKSGTRKNDLYVQTHNT